MTNILKHTIILITLLVTLIACKKVITVDLPSYEEKLIIEGEINSNFPAIVNLSYNMGYFEVIDSTTLANMFITDSSAIVVVSDGITTDTLSIMSITKFPYTAFVGNTILGEEGKSYTLDVSYKDKNYHAITSIPKSASFSEIWFESQLNNNSIGMINFSLIDDANENNYYSVSSLLIGEQWWYHTPIVGIPIFDDIFFNGDSTIVSLPKGYAGNDFYQPDIDTDEQWDSIFYFKVGENVSLRLSTIDQEFYLWWNSYYRSEFTGSNPYSNPSSVLSNIKGDPALGCWGGYANTIANVHITNSGTIEPISIEDIILIVLPDSI